MWARPFASANAWKGPVRAALLVLAAASAAIVALAGALDLRIFTGIGAAKTLTAGSYALVVLFGVTIAVLVHGVAAAMMQGAQDGRTRVSNSVDVKRPECFTAAPRRNTKNAASGHASQGYLVQQPEISTISASAPAPGSDEGSAEAISAAQRVFFKAETGPSNVGVFAVVPVRQRSSRRRQQSRQRPCSSAVEPDVCAAAKTFASDADLVATCDIVASALGRMSASEARAV